MPKSEESGWKMDWRQVSREGNKRGRKEKDGKEIRIRDGEVE